MVVLTRRLDIDDHAVWPGAAVAPVCECECARRECALTRRRVGRARSQTAVTRRIRSVGWAPQWHDGPIVRGPGMATGKAHDSRPRAPRTPNRVLRGIREQERRETRAEFAESMARVAREMGEEVYPDAKYVERLESGAISWPRPPYRNILAELCGRPIGELG